MLGRIALTALACFAIAGSLVGCGGGSAPSGSGSPARGGESDAALTLLIPVQADALDTTKASVGSLGVLLLGLEPLVLYDPASGDVKPNLAAKFSQEGPLTYRFRLRDGVKFWNGSPLTSEDVVFSIDLHRAKGSSSFIAQQWSSAESVTATSPDEVTIKLREPNPQFVYAVAQTGILSKAYYQRNRKRIGSPGVLNMGTGPYRFESFKPSAETVLVRNDDYWGAKPPIQRLDLRTIADDSTRLLAIQSGDADGAVGIPLAQLPTFERLRDFETTSAVDYSVYKFNFDLTKKPWDDPHLRRAFAYAVNRDAIARGLFKGQAEAATTLVPPSIMETLAPKAEVGTVYDRIRQEVPGFDLAKAKEELARSSVPHGVKTTLLVTGSDPNLSAIAQTVAQDLDKMGIHLAIKQVDDNTYYNAVYFKHTTDGLSLENFGADGPDPSNIPSNALDSRNGHPQGSGVNVSDYHDADVDRTLAESRRLKVDDPRRGQLVLEALTRAAGDLPFVPVVYPKIFMGLGSGKRWSDFGTFWWLSRWPYAIRAGS